MARAKGDTSVPPLGFLHVAWCVSGILGSLLVYGVLQAIDRPPPPIQIFANIVIRDAALKSKPN